MSLAPGPRAFRVERLGPIIVPGMDARIGENINGPSLVAVPDWVEERLGSYYLYFAHHNGDHIRLAFADAVTGPWRIYAPGALQHGESLFPSGLDRYQPGAVAPGMVVPLPHIASPDVHVDRALRRFRMYYHGIQRDRRQVTRIATSPDGIRFTAHPEVLGPSYFRVFSFGGWHYALAMPGIFYRSRDGLGDFVRGPRLFDDSMRHSAVLVEGNTLHVFYTNAGSDPPERILHATIALDGDWMGWQAGPPSVLLEPELDYEGVDLPLIRSRRGEITARARQLRDPAVFVDGDALYLLYAFAGEHGIALARLHRA